MQVTPSIFKAYDIRGIVPATVNAAIARGLGRAFGSAARAEGETMVAVGRDGRLSGGELASGRQETYARIAKFEGHRGESLASLGERLAGAKEEPGWHKV